MPSTRQMNEEQEFNVTGIAYQITASHRPVYRPAILEVIWFIPVNIKKIKLCVACLTFIETLQHGRKVQGTTV